MDKKGFSLIEMAMVLIIIGLIVGTIFPLIVSQIKKEKLSQGREIVEEAKNEIIGYAITHFSDGTTCLPPATTSTHKPEEIAHTTDIWGRDLRYYPALNSTGTGNNCFNICNYTSSSITPVSLTDKVSASNLAFAIASAGDDHHFQLDDSGYASTGEIKVTKAHSDILEYVTLDYLASKMDCAQGGGGGGGGGGPPGSDISFENDLSDFSLIIQSDSGVITSDDTSKTIALGNEQEDSFGCIWYAANGGPCNDGVCTLGTGFRAYFEFKTQDNDCSDGDTTDYGSGFTFAITSDVNSDPSTVCGGLGAHLGYGGVQPYNNYWIGEPKMGIEFDFYPSNSGDCPGWIFRPYCYNKEDGNNNHVAIIYWGNAYYVNGALTGKDRCSDKCPYLNSHNGDDNRHGAGSTGIYDSLNPSTSSSGYKGGNTACWLEDGQYHSVRIELHRDPASHTYTIKVWIDVDNSDDLTSDFTATPTISHTITISPEMDQKMNNIRFGWTEGSASLTQNVEIKDFGIKFLGD